MTSLERKSFQLRLNVLEMVNKGHAGHIGGDMSEMEILVAIYDRMRIDPSKPQDPDRDRFILSKGHSVEALYCVLADKGYFSIEEALNGFSKFGTKFIGHPTRSIPGIEMNTGSLGHGLSIATGMAIASKRSGRNFRVYTLLGDGELDEGSVWEAAMAASSYSLDNLIAVVDRNHLQISGDTEDVMKLGDIAGKFREFGWNAIDIPSGNSIQCLVSALDYAESVKGKPSALIAHTIKGYGSQIMENKVGWHHKVPSEIEYTEIQMDLKSKIKELSDEQHCE